MKKKTLRKNIFKYIFFICIVIFFLFFIFQKFCKKKENLQNENKKIAIITSIYGNYDELKEQNINNKSHVDWFCFTDKKILKKKGWKIINIPYHTINFNEYYENLKKKRFKIL